MWHQLSQLLQLLADKKAKLREDDITFLQSFVYHEYGNNEPLSAHTIDGSQLVRAVALLLKRLLEQHRLRSTGWQREAYCRMVRTAASSMHAICRRILKYGQPAATARISMSRHLAVSGVLQLLPSTLLKLASVMHSTTAPDHLAVAAHAVLAAVTVIISAWPGAAGIISSRDAGPLALPAVHLASTLEQHMVTMPTAYALELVITVRQLVIALAEQLVHQQQQHPDAVNQHLLMKSHDFLRLLLTFIAVELQPYPFAVKAVGATASAVRPVVSVPAAARDADTSCPVDQDSNISSSGSCSTTAQSKGTAEPAGAIESIGSPTARAVEACAAEAVADLPEAVSPPLQRTTAHVRQQHLQMLQLLHPAVHIGSDTDVLATLEKVLNTREGEPSSAPQLTALVQVAAQCVWSVARALGTFASDPSRIPASSSSSSDADSLQLCLLASSMATALCKLPLLLLYVWNSPTEAATAAPEFHKAVGKLISKIIQCWEAQLWLQAAGLLHGISEDQLPIAKLQDLLLEYLQLQVQQHSSSTAAATGSEGINSALSCSDTTPAPTPAAAAAAQSDAPASQTWAGGASKHSFIELLTMLGDLQKVTSNAHWKPAAAVTGMLEQCFRVSSSSGRGEASSQSCSCCCHLINHRGLPSLCNRFVRLFKRHRPQPGSSPDKDTSFTMSHWEPGPILLAATAAAPGSHEQQQLFTMLISISKRARLLPKQVQVSRSDPEQLTALHGCSLYGVVNLAAKGMLQHDISGSTSSERLLPSSSAACLAAMRPWLVVLGRNLIHLAEHLDALLQYDPACGSWEWYLDYPGPHDHGSGSQLVRYSYALTCWAQCVSDTIDGLLKACFCCADGDASHSTSNSSTAPAAQCPATAAAVVADSSPGMAEASASSSVDAVTQQQLSQLLQVQHQLQSDDLQPKFKELQDLTFKVYNVYIQDPLKDGEGLRRMTGELEQMAADSSPGLAAAARAMMSVQDSAAEFVVVLQQWGIQQWKQELLRLGSQVCAALPLSSCCNNPDCSNMRGDSELRLVTGKGCVCAGCETARYCGDECQAAHWQQHKVMCKAIKRQRRSAAAAAADPLTS